MGQENSLPLVDEDTPTQTLENRSVEAVGRMLKALEKRGEEGERGERVVVMTGAGISTSAGIPDFRSPTTGLYANLARLNLPYAEAVFDIAYFRNNPLPFYTLAQELYPGKYRPTITHSFIRLLHDKGILLKLFTQNIDCLEREAGVPGDKIVEAHGSFARQSCIECKTAYPEQGMKDAIREKRVPRCVDKACNGLVKPEIVFFGEQLPAEFFANRDLPTQAHLCIVMGTSLSVQPFAGLPALCREETPRVLLNMEQVGGIGSRPDDVLVLGDCDAGVRKLAEAAGWLEELEALWARTAPEKAAWRLEEVRRAKEEEERKSNMTADELMEEEVAKMGREVEETLRLEKEQHKWLEEHYAGKRAAMREQNSWLEEHVGGKAAMIGTEGTENAAEDGAAAVRRDSHPEFTEDSGPSDEKVMRPVDEDSGGGLGHVFPFLAKRSSL